MRHAVDLKKKKKKRGIRTCLPLPKNSDLTLRAPTTDAKTDITKQLNHLLRNQSHLRPVRQLKHICDEYLTTNSK